MVMDSPYQRHMLNISVVVSPWRQCKDLVLMYTYDYATLTMKNMKASAFSWSVGVLSSGLDFTHCGSVLNCVLFHFHLIFMWQIPVCTLYKYRGNTKPIRGAHWPNG